MLLLPSLAQARQGRILRTQDNFDVEHAIAKTSDQKRLPHVYHWSKKLVGSYPITNHLSISYRDEGSAPLPNPLHINTSNDSITCGKWQVSSVFNIGPRLYNDSWYLNISEDQRKLLASYVYRAFQFLKISGFQLIWSIIIVLYSLMASISLLIVFL